MCTYVTSPLFLPPSLPLTILLPRLNFGVPLSHLPRESRLCVTLHGLESSGSTDNPWNRFPIAWVMQRLFTSEGTLIFGPRLLGLWEGDRANPLDSPYSNITSSKCVLLELVFEDCGERVVCDDPPSQSPPSSTPQPGPPPSIYRGLKKMADTDRFSRYCWLCVISLACIVECACMSACICID